MTFLVNLMFRRLDKFDGFVFGVCGCLWQGEGGGGDEGIYGGYGGGLVFRILIGVHILGRGLIYGGVLTAFYGISSNYF